MTKGLRAISCKGSGICDQTIPPTQRLNYIAAKEAKQMIRLRNQQDNQRGSKIIANIRMLATCIALAMIAAALPLKAQDSTPPASETAPATADKTAPANAPPVEAAKTEAEQRADRALEARLKARKQQEEALTRIEASIALSNERQKELKDEIAQLRSDRETVQNDLIATAERIKNLETSLSDRETRLRTLFADQTNLRVSLAEQRDSLSEILAALQRIGRNPPPALFIRPNEALSAFRYSAQHIGARGAARSTIARRAIGSIDPAAEQNRTREKRPSNRPWHIAGRATAS